MRKSVSVRSPGSASSNSTISAAPAAKAHAAVNPGSMTKVTLYGIPTCGTVRKARRWLDSAGMAHDWVDIRENPPGLERIQAWIRVLGCRPLRNTSGRAYRALPAARNQWSDKEWARAFAMNPMLLRRPVVEAGGVPVLVGFRPELWERRLSGPQKDSSLRT